MDQPISRHTINRRHRIKFAVIVVLMMAFCAAAWGINRVVRPSADIDDLIVSEVRRGAIRNTINASGVVVPVHEELVSSPIQSRVAKVHAKPGQEVKAGELLVELDARSVTLALDSLQEQMAQQENRVLALTQEMEQKRKQLASSIELLELDLHSATVKLGRFQKLRTSGAVSGEDLLAAELAVKRHQIQLRQQRELIDDTRRSTQTSIEGARLQKSILHKQLDQQRELLARAQVRAPFAGMLTSLVTEEGASIATGQLVAKVSALDNYRVEATVSDFHARSLAQGQAVRVEHGSQVLDGQVQVILPEIQNGMVKLLVSLAQPSHPLLRNKLRVEANIVTEEKPDTLVADFGPAFNGRGKQTLYLVRDGVAHKTTLDIGAGDGKQVEIVAGAQAGDRVIVSDLSRYKHLDKIRISQ